jgi:HAE1 family hydrophobic/amphiphilic exporter-1
MNRKSVHAVILAALAALVLTAPPAAAAGTAVLTIEQALKIASEQNRDIHMAREYIVRAQGKFVEERAGALPQLTAVSAISRDRDNSLEVYGPIMAERQNKKAAEIMVTQPLFTWGQVSSSIKAASANIKSADEQLRLYQQAARKHVSMVFYDILLAKELHRLALQNLEQKSRHYDEAMRKYSAGVATDYDVLAAKVAVENARPETIRMDNNIRILRERLRFLLAMEGEVDVSGSLDGAMRPYPAYDEALAVARDRRPELADLKHRVDMYGELVKVADALDKPRIDLKGGYGWRDLAVQDYSSDGPAWNIGVQVTFPFFDGMRTRGRVAQAQSDYRSVKIEEAKKADNVALETRDAVNALKESQEIVRALTGTVSQAERLLAMAEKGYELGVKIRLEVDDAELNLIQARSSLSRARRDYLIARMNLDWVMGILGEREK